VTLAVVTGAAQGIGRGIAERLAADGAAVIAADITSAGREPPVPGQVASWRLDVTSEADWAAVSPLRPSVLVNNAGGVGPRAWLHEQSLDDWNATLALNLTSVFLGMRAVLPAMLEARSGTIVNLCSISGLRAHADAPAYQAAKNGIEALTRSAAVAYSPLGVRVNAVTPSIVDTPQVAGETPEHIASFLSRVPTGRMGSPADIAGAVAFLVGDDAGFVTGANLLVDGGFLA
jgi:NAD(P)-dependent dehydrogenase (short-subunit alcohol dehydrogenase family)